jgi:hypothetical protein
MTTQEKVAEFLGRRMEWSRMAAPSWMLGDRYHWEPRPTPELLANALLHDAEFRALRLGTWLGTVDGQVLAEAVEMVTPPFYRQDVELLVEALKLAAALQQTEGQDRAGKFALGAIGVAAMIALGIAASGGGKAA